MNDGKSLPFFLLSLEEAIFLSIIHEVNLTARNSSFKEYENTFPVKISSLIDQQLIVKKKSYFTGNDFLFERRIGFADAHITEGLET